MQSSLKSLLYYSILMLVGSVWACQWMVAQGHIEACCINEYHGESENGRTKVVYESHPLDVRYHYIWTK